ncbi:hypothetical protein Hdeb2414_s0003g00115141 [Helianthus debilis subsp. tardiflorus]
MIDRFNNLVTGPVSMALCTRLHSVHEYKMEFYSTFAFKAKTEPFDEEGVEFRCAGNLFAEEDAGDEENTGGLHEISLKMRQMAWSQIGEGPYDPSQTKSSQLRDPLYRYIHRVLSNSLNQRRDSTGVVNLRDLRILYCIHNRMSLNVPHLLCQNMHLNQLANPPTPIFYGAWIYRLYKNFVQKMPRSFRKGPWSGKVDLVICRSMGIINEAGDGTVRFQTLQGHVWNPHEALVLHAAPIRPPPQFHGHAGLSSSQGGGNTRNFL